MNRRTILKAIAALPAMLTLPSFCQREAKADDLKTELVKKIDRSWRDSDPVTVTFSDDAMVHTKYVFGTCGPAIMLTGHDLAGLR